MARRRRGVLMVTLVGALAGLAFLTAGQPGAVDWRRLRAVALHSDDWGLAGFVPSVDAWVGLDRAALSPGRFPDVYWNSTLEDSACVARLAAVLAGGRGRDGRPAVLQPNYVVSALDWTGGQWVRRDLPDFPETYRRPGLWQAMAEAMWAGVWYPEYHAAWHYDPQRRRQAVAAGGVALAAAERGVMLFPGSEAARELGPWRPTSELAAELDAGLAVFTAAFGRGPGSIIAPDYTWDGRCEDLWESRGLTVIQAKREQRHPGLPPGAGGRVLKVLDRQWSRARHRGRIYLERNCRLEPAQAPDAGAVVAACLDQTRRAWRCGEPAIVETHRVNFAHGDAAVAAAGREALAVYLAGLAGLGETGPVFLVDAEIASLVRRGTSLVEAGDVLVARNGTRSRRLAIPVAPAGPPKGTVALYLLEGGFQGLVAAGRSR
ncbi:MAG: hypothetical protein IPK64_08640 [bacterium]|nr:hypothetical protein [bacterium]